MFLVIYFLLELALLAGANTTHNVTVGVEGSFFDPQTVSAAEGDIVNFLFGGDFHDITQSNFSNPCSPLPGGFSSGFLGRGANFEGPVVMFSLTITNDSEPIWFFCAATMPTSHCNSGMVGSINPPSQDEFNSYVQAAQQDTTTPRFSPTLVLNGIGATASPLITLSDTNFTSTPIASPTPSPIPISNTISSPTSTSSSSASHSNNHGGVIGGAVAAAVGAFLLLCIGAFLYRRYKRQRRVSTGSNFFAYNHTPSGARSPFSSNASPPHTAETTTFSSTHSPGMINAFDIDRGGNHSAQKQPLLFPNAMMSDYSNSNRLANAPLQPIRGFPHTNNAGHITGQNINTQGGPMYGDQPSVNREGSYGVVLPAQPMNQHRPGTASEDTSSDQAMDIQTLAREVATVLLEKKSRGQMGGRQVDSSAGTGSSAGLDSDPHLSAPPRYYTANNTAE